MNAIFQLLQHGQHRQNRQGDEFFLLSSVPKDPINLLESHSRVSIHSVANYV